MTYERRAPLWTAGAIAGAVLLAIIALALHPHITGHPAPQAELREIGMLSVRDAAVATLTASLVAVNMFSSFAIVAMAIAIGAWSLDLAHDPGESRIAGIVGLVSAAVTVAVLVTGGPFLKPHALIAVLCAQGVWYVWIAVLLARGQA